MKSNAVNLITISESDLSKYRKLKEGDEVKSGDLVHMYDDKYATIGKYNILLKYAVNKYNIILRNKK